MKTLIIALILLSSCSTTKSIGYTTVTVTHRNGNHVIARKSYMWYEAYCNFPDSVKKGTVLKLMYSDTCCCNFKRIMK